MSIILYDHQQELKNGIYAGWNAGHRNVLGVSPTGSGKTVLFANITSEHVGHSMLIAHRQELVSQISLALGQQGVYHRIWAPDKTIKTIERTQIRELGHSFHNTSAKAMIGGVDTLLSRRKSIASICQQVTLMVQDEGHHVLADNKWGKAAQLFPNAKGLLVTATPLRADGAGLGRHADGLVDHMVLGPEMRELIELGKLADYRIFAPESDIDIDSVDISSATGDFNKHQLRKAVAKSHIVGDIVEQYLKIAPGKQGITFVTDVATAQKVADRYNAAGVAAVALSAKSNDSYRQEMIDRFRHGKIKILVNVDLFGEGFDVPAVEVVQFARHTASFGLYVQQFGRALRKFAGKTHGIIIDHVSNVKRHGLPDRVREWTLDRIEKRGRGQKADDLIPVVTCDECGQSYEAIHRNCPYCGSFPKRSERSGPKEVHGDLTEMDPMTLKALRGEIMKADRTPSSIRMGAVNRGVAGNIADNMAMNHQKSMNAQGFADLGTGLRGAIAWWAGYQKALGQDDSESYRRFYFKFGIDVMSAQALKTKEARNLEGVIRNELTKLGHSPRS